MGDELAWCAFGLDAIGRAAAVYYTDKGISCDFFGWEVVQHIDDLATMEVSL